MDYPEIGKVYKHYKGGDYKVLTLAKHTETDEILVIYKSIQFGSIYARPLHIWNNSDGLTEQRFKKIN